MIHLLFSLLFTLSAFAGPQGKLGDEIAARRARVPEFTFIADEAKKLGVRAWLFGGTAAGYAHYVKWDLAREGGDERYQKDRFDYDYTNIYRSTQDLDIVIDGPPEKAEELEKLLQERFPHFQGTKSAWEVRLLRSQRGEKEALLGNPNYLNQHTDSNSTGMIELTSTNDPVVRDLLEWNNPDPHFLKDVREGKLHYYFSPLHETTNRAAQGLNPPIESAIRYLTKAFQYELEMRPEDLAKVKQVIDDWDPKSGRPEVKAWIEKNGKKLFQHAVNLEYAKNTVDELGLSPKLIALSGGDGVVDSLGWWMQKEPLRSGPVGEGSGATAAELFEQRGFAPDPSGKLVVAHETNNFLAYESITRAHTGDPNVLISRGNRPGEAAVYGDGFYTAVGRQGAAGTGLTIRFELDPNAREGTDFLAPSPPGTYFVIRNKRALKVIPESLNWSLLDYYHFLANSDGFDKSDKALMEKLRRRVGARTALTNPAEYDEVARFVAEAQRGAYNPALLTEWLADPQSVGRSDELFRVMTKERPMEAYLLKALRESKVWSHRPETTKLSDARMALDPKYATRQLAKKFIDEHGAFAANTLALGWSENGRFRDLAAIVPYIDIPALGQAETEALLPRLGVSNPKAEHMTGPQAKYLKEALFHDPRTATWKKARYKWMENAPRAELIKLFDEVSQDLSAPTAPKLLEGLADHWRNVEFNGPNEALTPAELDRILKKLKPVYKDPKFERVFYAVASRCYEDCYDALFSKYIRPGGPALHDDMLADAVVNYIERKDPADQKWIIALEGWMQDHGGVREFPATVEGLLEKMEGAPVNTVVERFLPQLDGPDLERLMLIARDQLDQGGKAKFSEGASRVVAAALRKGIDAGKQSWLSEERAFVRFLTPKAKKAFGFSGSPGCPENFAKVAE